MSSFVRYVLQHKNENTPWGDVAKDFAHPACEIKHTWGYRTTKRHLEEQGAINSVMAIVEEMNERYKHIKREAKARKGQWMGLDD